MPRPMRGVPEKSKNFSQSMKRLFMSLEKWKYLVIIALVLGMFSATFSIIAPNILSDLTDEITEGIKPNTKRLETISKNIMESFTDRERLTTVMMDPSISSDAKIKFSTAMSSLNSNSKRDDIVKVIKSMDKSILSKILKPITIDGSVINVKDQIKFLNILSNIGFNSSNEDIVEQMDKLPRSIYNLVKPVMDINMVKKIAFIIAILHLVGALFSYIQAYIMATVSNNFARRLRSNVSGKINRLPLKYFDTHETGDVLSRVTNDIDSIGMNMNNSLSTLVTSITLFLGSVIMMFVTNWIMAITAVFSSIFGFLMMGIILKKSQKYFSLRQKELGRLNGHIEEMYSGHLVVKAYNGVDESMKDFERFNNKLYVCNKKSQFLSGIMQPIMMFVGNFGYVAVCVVGAILTMNDLTTFGTIVAFMIYIRLFTNPLSQIAQAMTMLQSTAAAGERVFEFLDESEMSSESDIVKHLDKSKVRGEIEFNHVKFSYNKNREIIKDFSAKAHPGEKIAIVGPTGAGKTTMVNLLMKFYEINDGDILIDGVSTKNLTRENIHDLFVMVLQDTWLFDGTIAENIRFNKENVTDEEIWDALKTVGVDHFVKTLPGGINSTIGDETSVSSGQKQLLTIARGMIEDAPFLILDEATSNVDTRTEELVQKAMDKLTEGRTSFIIAHRLSTIKNADLILVMNEGNIIETGTHEELLKQNGFYANLYNSQFEI